MWIFDVAAPQTSLLMKSKMFLSSMFIAFLEVPNPYEGPSLRCIQLLYGGYGHNVIKELRTNVSLSLPRILTHLKQKQEDVLMMLSSSFNKLWKPVFAANHHMSLDHHDAYLEQQDSKFWCNNDLLAEINGISDERSEDTKLDFMFPGCIDDNKHIAEPSISDEHIMNSNASITNEPEETRGQDGADSFLEFLTNEIDFSPIVDLEKGGFATFMHNSKKNYDKEGVSSSEEVVDNVVEIFLCPINQNSILL